ncbi:MAG: glutaminyl-peptide cyclotransferase [Chryseolinea sp.]
MRFGSVGLLILVLVSCGEKKGEESASTVDSLAIPYAVLKTLPHNTDAFTEGLTIYNGKVLESTGQNGKSWVAEVDPGSGEHSKKITLDDRYFGEGMTVLNDKLYYLTWQTKVGFIYDSKTYKQIGEFNYENEGWGLTHDGTNLIMSGGTEKLYFLDTTSLKVTRTLTVTDHRGSVKKLNELEYVNGYIFANIYETPIIAKIDPASGRVVGRIDLSVQVNEIKRMFPNTAELNGIAFDKNSNAMLVTGKNWPRSYLIRLQK